jgi:hypothetical protein
MKWIMGLALAAAVGAAACTTQSGVPNGCGGFAAGASPACTHGPTAAPGGLSQAAAIAAARRVAPLASGDPAVIWASIEHSPFAANGTGERTLVWEVRLQAAFAASACPSGFLEVFPTPSDPACLDQESGLIAVLDYYSGTLLGWTH